MLPYGPHQAELCLQYSSSLFSFTDCPQVPNTQHKAKLELNKYLSGKAGYMCGRGRAGWRRPWPGPGPLALHQREEDLLHDR